MSEGSLIFPVPDAEFYTLKWDCCVVPGQVTYKIMLCCSDLLKSGKTNSLLGLLNWMCTCCSVVSCNVNLNEQWDPAESKKHCCLFSLALPTHERSQSAVIYIVMLFENSLSLSGLFFFNGGFLLRAGCVYLLDLNRRFHRKMQWSRRCRLVDEIQDTEKCAADN